MHGADKAGVENPAAARPGVNELGVLLTVFGVTDLAAELPAAPHPGDVHFCAQQQRPAGDFKAGVPAYGLRGDAMPGRNRLDGVALSQFRAPQISLCCSFDRAGFDPADIDADSIREGIIERICDDVLCDLSPTYEIGEDSDFPTHHCTFPAGAAVRVGAPVSSAASQGNFRGSNSVCRFFLSTFSVPMVGNGSGGILHRVGTAK